MTIACACDRSGGGGCRCRGDSGSCSAIHGGYHCPPRTNNGNRRPRRNGVAASLGRPSGPRSTRRRRRSLELQALLCPTRVELAERVIRCPSRDGKEIIEIDSSRDGRDDGNVVAEETTLDRASSRGEEGDGASSRGGEDAGVVVFSRKRRCGAARRKGTHFGGNGLIVELKMVVKMPAKMVDSVDPRLEMI